MGSNIFSRWDNQANEEKERQQAKMFCIESGHIGYLRATLGMISEGSFLKTLFPKEYWECRDGKGVRFEFTEERFKELQKAGLAYLIAAFTGKELKCSDTEKQKATNQRILDAIKKAGYTEDQIGHSGSLSFRMALIWLESIFSFFELGMSMEKKGLNPKVLIKW